MVFAAGEEVVTLSHSALDRGMFARGALLAARWVVGQPPGEYDMQDVLGRVDGFDQDEACGDCDDGGEILFGLLAS